MNDDRKFQERAEVMKELFLARIPADVIANVAGISKCTVMHDRARVAKHYGIVVPCASVNVNDRAERFRLLLKTYLTVKFETFEWENSLYQAAKLLIEFDRINNHINSIEIFWKEAQKPRFISNDSESVNYQRLIEDCYSVEEHRFNRDFYEYLYNGKSLIETISREDDLVELATKFCLSKDRSCLNSLTIEDPKSLVDQLFSSLTEIQRTVIEDCYGLKGEIKTLSKIGEEHRLTRERIRQIRDKSLDCLRSMLENKKYLIHSTSRYKHLEKRYAELDERYNVANDAAILLEKENTKLRSIYEENNIKIDEIKIPSYLKILTKQVWQADDLPVRLRNCLRARDYEYILDAVEDWDSLIHCQNFGKMTYKAFDNYLLDYGLDRKKLTTEEKDLARQLILVEKELDT